MSTIATTQRPTCATCPYWRPKDPKGPYPEQSTCERYPPKWDEDTGDRQPLTLGTNTCGEHPAFKTAEAREAAKEGIRWRHKKRGSIYTILHVGWLQTSNVIGDITEVMVYQDEDGTVWVRPTDEFHDGRFEAVE